MSIDNSVDKGGGKSGHLILIASMVLMGTAYVSAKFALRVTEPFTTAFFRFLIASLVMWPILFGLKLKQTIRKEHAGLLIRHALFHTTFYFALQYTGMQFTSTTNTALITNTRPIILALLAVIFLRERFSIIQWGALLLAFAGVVLILRDPYANFVPTHLRGDFLILLTAVSGALGIMFLKQLLEHYHPFTILVYQATIGMFGLLPLALYERGGYLFAGEIAWIPIIYMAVFLTFGSQVLLNVGLSKLPVSVSGVYLFLVPAASVVYAYFLLDEPVTWRLVIGGLLILTGTYVINNKDKFSFKKRRADPIN